MTVDLGWHDSILRCCLFQSCYGVVDAICSFLFQSFVSCPLGIENIGYVMICYGVVDVIFSFLFSHLLAVLLV